MRRPAHAGNDRRNLRRGQTKPQRQFRQRLDFSAEQPGQCLRPLFGLRLSLSGEVPVAPVTGRKHRVGFDLAGQCAFVERNPHDNAERLLLGEAKQRPFRRTVVNIVDDLGGLEDRIFEHAQRRLGRVIVDRDPPVEHLAFFFKARDADVRLLPLGIVQPCVVPYVELLDGNCLHAEVLERLFGRIEDVARGKYLRDRCLRMTRPDAVHGWNLRRHHNATGADVILQGFADQLLAVAPTVRQCRIEKVDAVVDRFAQRFASIRVVDAAPHVAAESPGAVAERADAVARLAEWSSLHALTMRSIDTARNNKWRFRQADGTILERWTGTVVVHVAGKRAGDEVVFGKPGDRLADSGGTELSGGACDEAIGRRRPRPGCGRGVD